ncbi:hypothetical protein FACS1894180_8920 [Bacteroidia bacterium]|nr:hypothetical protein FACS1894180_8920 [Bacteroidia bacterium]
MKKMLFVLLPVLILTVSCGNKGKFSLNGTLQDTVFNGKTIYLTDYIDREYIPFDSAVVKDGKFSISTVCDSSRVVFLTVALLPGADPIVLPVVMEKGKAQVEIGNTSFVLNGTPQNIILQQFAETETQIAKQLDDYKMQLDADTTMADSTRTILYNQMDELTTQQYADMAFDKAKQNVNTAVGTYIFQNSYYYFKPQKIDEILTLTDEQIKKTPKMQKIIASNELEKTLQPGSKYVDFKSLMPAGDTLLLSNLIGQKEYLLLDFWTVKCISHWYPVLQPNRKLKNQGLYMAYFQ